LVSYPARWAGLTNRAPMVRRMPFGARTATLSASKGLNSAAPQPAASAHSIQRRAEGKFPKALPEAGRSRADGPAFLSPARKGWVCCSVGSRGLKVRDRASAWPHATPPPIPSLQAGVNPLVSHPARWAGLTNRAPMVRRMPFGARTATLSASKGLSSQAAHHAGPSPSPEYRR